MFISSRVSFMLFFTENHTERSFRAREGIEVSFKRFIFQTFYKNKQIIAADTFIFSFKSQ